MLSSKKRLEKVIDLEEPDRVPACYMYHGASSNTLRITGLTWKDIYFSENAAIKAIMAAHKLWGHDNACSIISPIYGLEDLGIRVNVPEYAEPFVDPKMQFLKEETDVDRLIRNWQKKPFTSLKSIKTATMLKKEFGDAVPIVGGFGGISTWAFFLRRIDNFIKDFKKNRYFQELYMRAITNIAIDYCVQQLKAGCDYIISGEDAFATDLFSPEQAWVCNGIYAKELCNAIHQEGGYYILHCCGDAIRALNLMIETGADIISLDRVNLRKAKKILQNKAALMGNVKSSILLGKTPYYVEQDCIRAMNEGMERGGYVLSCGYIYPYATPSNNVSALVNAAKTYGVYKTFMI